MKRGFIKGEALTLLRTNSCETTFEESISKFKLRLIAHGYPPPQDDTDNVIRSQLRRKTVGSTAKEKPRKQILPFVTTYHPSVRNLKKYIDAKLEVHTKSAFAEKHIQKSANYILQERTIS